MPHEPPPSRQTPTQLAAELHLRRIREEKIHQYEVFINDRLKVDLEHTLAQRETIYKTISEYLKLKNNLELIQAENLSKLKALVNLGADCFVQAKVPDTTYVYVHIGLGFHCQFTLDEAIEFIGKREAHLSEQAEELSVKSAEISARIKL
eukprot:CAMPEP_0174244794 /NCGR_PEP_ID=MMETSP0417-20130205/36678_1 /TAXON_ID=242541 /ORGANISM="Mayorella sp, Strain BSH-02190019" /LENGTH=149 /DNA_ID=CAMNT_0015324519 /DNA_START=28 /DNA_END=474 /DNA_ORIENTATION=+